MTDAYRAECPACLAQLNDARRTLDSGQCVACGTGLKVIYALTDGLVDRSELEDLGDGGPYQIPAETRREKADALDALEDPAETTQRETKYV